MKNCGKREEKKFAEKTAELAHALSVTQRAVSEQVA